MNKSKSRTNTVRYSSCNIWEYVSQLKSGNSTLLCLSSSLSPESNFFDDVLENVFPISAFTAGLFLRFSMSSCSISCSFFFNLKSFDCILRSVTTGVLIRIRFWNLINKCHQMVPLIWEEFTAMNWSQYYSSCISEREVATKREWRSFSM